MTTTIIKNLRRARAVIAAIPESAIDLEEYRTDCGTIACTVGHLCDHPDFAKFMGLEWDGDAWSLRSRLPDGSLVAMPTSEELDPHFGPNAFRRLFAQRNHGTFNDGNDQGGYDYVPDSVTDKTLALWRIDRQIINVANNLK
jgi:hypothetical protein